MRSVAAAAKRMEKEAERRHKQAVKQQTAADAAEAVSNWETYIEELLTIHVNQADKVDWHRMLAKQKPKEPVKLSRTQDNALAELTMFRPSLLDRALGRTAKKLSRLEKKVEDAKVNDERDHKKALDAYYASIADSDSDRELAKRLIAGEVNAIQEVIKEMQSLTKTDLIGSTVDFTIAKNYVHARPLVHSDEIVPTVRRKQLASGKLSESKMPAGQFNELYQDYVSSVALKVAGDLFQILPIDEVYVTCGSDMLNTSTGHKEPTPILSVQFVRSTFSQLNLANIDPSDSLRNFNHSMKFSRTKGFAPIQPLGVDVEIDATT